MIVSMSHYKLCERHKLSGQVLPDALINSTYQWAR